jgi:hypothetical protein
MIKNLFSNTSRQLDCCKLAIVGGKDVNWRDVTAIVFLVAVVVDRRLMANVGDVILKFKSDALSTVWTLIIMIIFNIPTATITTNHQICCRRQRRKFGKMID